MAEFLSTYTILHNLKKIVQEANKQVVLVSPYIKLSGPTFHSLKVAADRNIVIKMIHGKRYLNKNELKTLEEIKNIELYFVKDLHAKCYLNESKMIITSMNLYEFSENNNLEMGVLIDRKNDELLFENAITLVGNIFSNAKRISFISDNSAPTEGDLKHANLQVKIPGFKKPLTQYPPHGHCIRCNTKIEFDPNHPYCNKCFSIWNLIGKYHYPEKRCHACGETETTSRDSPICYTCHIALESFIET